MFHDHQEYLISWEALGNKVAEEILEKAGSKSHHTHEGSHQNPRLRSML